MASPKCTQARRAGEGAGRGGHSPARPRSGPARVDRGGRGRRGWGPGAEARSPPSLTVLPPPPLPRGAPGGPPRGGTRARAGLGAAPRGGPGPVGPRHTLGADLPPSRPRRSNFLLGPRAGRVCLPGLAGSGAGRPQGALALPKSRRRCPRGGCGCGRAGRRPCALELAAVCSLQEAKHFTHFLKCSFLLPGSRWDYF